MAFRKACPQQKCQENFVAICFGLTAKIANLTGLKSYIKSVTMTLLIEKDKENALGYHDNDTNAREEILCYSIFNP